MSPLTTPRIGELRYQVDIVNVGPPYNVDGSGAITSIHKRNVRAKIEPFGGDLQAETQEMQTVRQSYNVWIRYLDGVTAFQQIDWAGTRLIITGPVENFTRWLLIHAESRTNRKF